MMKKISFGKLFGTMKEKAGKGKKTIKFSKNKKIALFFIVYTLVTLVVTDWGARYFFKRTAEKSLPDEVNVKALEFSSNVNGEMQLATQLAISPLVSDYMQHPEDKELTALAMREIKSYEQSFKSKSTFSISDKDLKYYLNCEEKYVLDKSLETSAWFDICRNVSEAYTFYIDYEEVLKKTMMWVNAVVRDKKGNGIGLIGTGIDLSAFSDMLFSNLNPEYQMFFYNEAGEITGADDTKLMENKVLITDVFRQIANKDLQVKGTAVYPTFSGVFVVKEVPSVNWHMIIYDSYSRADFARNALIPLVSMFMCIFAIMVSFITASYMQKSEKALGKKLFEETQKLAVATKETAATSQDSSAAVKEIVATMEDSNSLSENISQKIKDVSSVARKNFSDVQAGVASIARNVEQLHAIFDANQQNISGMKVLSEKIESIWDIVTLINSIADQAKIIAFNTELEVASAGEAGEPFRIVASEIRRLSDGIIDGTKEIKEKITEIQRSSDSLILSSESSTEKINAGYASAKDLGAMFESIKSSSEITAASAQDITDIIQQQTIGSEQILIALKQISGGVESFSAATENISQSAENIRIISEDLKNQVND